MKAIFLDHDGVICLSTEWGNRFKKQKKWVDKKLSMNPNSAPIEYRFDNFNKKAIKVLNDILEITNAEIIVSSDWKRWANIEEMGLYYELQGILKKPISFTPNLSECNNYDETFVWDRELDLEQSRSLEIKQYLLDHPEVIQWVAIDDLNMGKIALRHGVTFTNSWGLDNFVLTPKSNQGIKQTGIKEKIIDFLNG